MRIFLLIALLFAPLPVLAQDSGADIEINQYSVRFSEDPLIAGEEVRLYASVRNIGNVDVSGYVYFYQGPTPLGPSQVISLAAEGESEDVWIDFIVPDGPFNIRAELRGLDPADEYTGNNEYLSTVFEPVFDTDGDGVIDDEDNCPEDANSDQRDEDGNGVGYVCDEDEQRADEVVEPELEEEPIVEVEESPTPELISLPEPNPAAVSDLVETTISDPLPEDNATEFAIEAIAENIAAERVSPGAQFTYELLKWRTYAFRVIDAEDDASYKWDFGDGSSSVQPSIGHEFRGPGVYRVTLIAEHADGAVTSDEVEITVSFFHIQNPIIQLIITLLVILIALTLAGMFGLRTRGIKRKRMLTTEDGVLYTKGKKLAKKKPSSKSNKPSSGSKR